MVMIQNEGIISLWNIITRYLFGIFFFEVMTSFSFVCGEGETLFPKMFCVSSPLKLVVGWGVGWGDMPVKSFVLGYYWDTFIRTTKKIRFMFYFIFLL